MTCHTCHTSPAIYFALLFSAFLATYGKALALFRDTRTYCDNLLVISQFHLHKRGYAMSGEEKLLRLPDAVEAATGQCPHLSTLHRWRLRGIAGVKLETVRCGGRRLCSIESVRRFLDGVTAAADGKQAQPRTPKQRSRDAESATRQLEQAGI